MNALAQPHVWPFLGFLGTVATWIFFYFLGYSTRAMREGYIIEEATELIERNSKVLERVEPAQ